MSTPAIYSEAWQGITLGTVRFTGEVKLSGAALKKKLDRRRAPGADGARIVDRGFDLAEITLHLRGWEEPDGSGDDHLAQLDAIQEAAFPRGGPATRRNALDVVHPALNRAGITQLYFTEAGLLEDQEDGSFTQEFKAVEYRPPPARSVTHTPAAGADAGDAPIDPGVQQVFNDNPIPEPAATP